MPDTDLQPLSADEFKRRCRVSRETFAARVAVCRPPLERQGRRGGQRSIETESLNGCPMALMCRRR